MLEWKMTQCKPVSFQDAVVGNAAKCKKHIIIFAAVRLKFGKKKTVKAQKSKDVHPVPVSVVKPTGNFSSWLASRGR